MTQRTLPGSAWNPAFRAVQIPPGIYRRRTPSYFSLQCCVFSLHAVAYEQSLGGTSKMILAGQMSYDQDAPGAELPPCGCRRGHLVPVRILRWFARGQVGPRRAHFSRRSHRSGWRVSPRNRVAFRYGGEYVLVGLGAAASSLRPRAEINIRISDDWSTALIFASVPVARSAGSE